MFILTTNTHPITLSWQNLKAVIDKHVPERGFAKEIASGKVVLESNAGSKDDVAKYEAHVGCSAQTPQNQFLQVKLSNGFSEQGQFGYYPLLDKANFKFVNYGKSYMDDESKGGIGPWAGVSIPVTIEIRKLKTDESEDLPLDPYTLPIEWVSEETGGDLELARAYYKACYTVLQKLAEETAK